jgi:hypothetical protein
MRSASSYRGARRNEHHRRASLLKGSERKTFLSDEREVRANQANAVAHLGQRTMQARAAREAAARALAGDQHSPPANVMNHALLDFYRGQKPTRPVTRIVRQLERAVAKAA